MQANKLDFNLILLTTNTILVTAITENGCSMQMLCRQKTKQT